MVRIETSIILGSSRFVSGDSVENAIKLPLDQIICPRQFLQSGVNSGPLARVMFGRQIGTGWAGYAIPQPANGY
jgi:hypothetical protein